MDAMIVDSHCHLDFPELARDLDGVRARAAKAGVGTMLTIGTRLATFEQTQLIAEAHPEIYCSVGVHPHEAAKAPTSGADDLIARAQHAKVVGIGETGFDFYYDNAPRADQERVFRHHVEAAQATGLPIIIHTRDADEATGDLLVAEHGKAPFAGVLHCFTGGPELARRALEIGFYVSFSGIVTFKTAGALREVAAEVPLDRLLVETDAPYLAPVPYRGKRNEPSYVVHTLDCLADAKGVSRDTLARQTTDNFFRLFSKAVRPS